MSSRFKNLGFGSKRKSNANIQTVNNLNSAAVASPNGSTSTAGTPPPPNASQTSLPPMNPNQPAAPGRPPSYSYNSQGRPQSPMPPPQNPMAHHPAPIDTRAGAYVGGAPQLGPPQPPGYGGAYGHQPQLGPQPGIQHMAQQYPPGSRPAAEVEGAGRSKAQLIVGIDFVRRYPSLVS